VTTTPLQETLNLFGSQANAKHFHATMAEADAPLPAGARILGFERADQAGKYHCDPGRPMQISQQMERQSAFVGDQTG
jgi:hypothetical protein